MSRISLAELTVMSPDEVLTLINNQQEEVEFLVDAVIEYTERFEHVVCYSTAQYNLLNMFVQCIQSFIRGEPETGKAMAALISNIGHELLKVTPPEVIKAVNSQGTEEPTKH